MMIHAMLACACAALVAASAAAQTTQAVGADSVESFTPGAGAGYGFEYFPGNVLGLPDTSARSYVATIDPHQILGIGIGGEIILRFDRLPVVDGPGPDFTVFENPFTYEVGGRERVYAEPAEVAVSRDGVHFVAFPFDSLTLHGCAGVTPTNGDRDPGDPSVSGGDAFDLSTLGVDSVRFVRLRDVTGMVKSNRQHPFWDATLSGFDLDAVVALPHTAAGDGASGGEFVAGRGVTVAPNPIANDAVLAFDMPQGAYVEVRWADQLGRLVDAGPGAWLAAGRQRLRLDATSLAPGAYSVVILADGVPWRTLRAVVMR